MKKNLSIGCGCLLAAILLGFVAIQLIPYGRNHTNPQVVKEPNWDSLQTRRLAQRACFDCHSNETAWPWYTNIAPVSWLIQHDVDEGRQVLNFSTWNGVRGEDEERGEGNEGRELGEVVAEGEMPPSTYLILHSEARLSTTEKQQLIQGLEATSVMR